MSTELGKYFAFFSRLLFLTWTFILYDVYARAPYLEATFTKMLVEMTKNWIKYTTIGRKQSERERKIKGNTRNHVMCLHNTAGLWSWWRHKRRVQICANTQYKIHKHARTHLVTAKAKVKFWCILVHVNQYFLCLCPHKCASFITLTLIHTRNVRVA